MTPADRVVIEVPARVHLAGNPSDGYRGAVLSTTVAALSAEVAIEAADHFTVHGPSRQWTTLVELVADTSRHGHEGGDRLVTAALVALDRIVASDVVRRPGRISWTTAIPRSVGLGGSSALVIATMRAALRWWQAEDRIGPMSLARGALDAEVGELHIAAGLADRSAQVLGGTVLTDCRADEPVACRVEPAQDMDIRLLWSDAAAEPSGRYHHELRRRFEAGDPTMTDVVATLALLAERAAEAVRVGDRAALAQSVDASLRARCALGPVPEAAMEPVAQLRAGGASVNFAGSGGALVVVGDAPTPAGWNALDLTLR